MQFFSSKKRKTLSPGLKSRRVERDAKHTAEGSPSAKGTLDNYLTNSQEDKSITKASLAVTGQEPVKRNLYPEITECSKDKNNRCESLEGFKAIHEKTIPDNVGCLVKDCSDSALVPENMELKQFATDFLSLYCRYVTLNCRKHLHVSLSDLVWIRISRNISPFSSLSDNYFFFLFCILIF